MGALRHDLHRADARHGGAEPRGTEERVTRTGGGKLAIRQRMRRTSQRHWLCRGTRIHAIEERSPGAGRAGSTSQWH